VKGISGKKLNLKKKIEKIYLADARIIKFRNLLASISCLIACLLKKK
jgi:hypothetical protein